MEGGNISLKIEPDEELENNLLQQVKLEVKTENNLQVKSEVFLKEEVLSYQTPEFEFVSVSPNHPPIKVEFTKYPNKSGYIQVRSFNNDCFKHEKTDRYSIDYKDSKKYRCKQDVCLKWPVKGGYCVKHGGIKVLGARQACKSLGLKSYKTNPNISGSTEVRSFNNDCPNREHKEEYSNNKGTQLRSTCKEVVCSNVALKGGYCKKHGGLKVSSKCKEDSCSKWPEKGGYCIKHGGIKIHLTCKNGPCSKQALKGGLCKEHGGIHSTCKVDDCPKWRAKGGYCKKHGGIKVHSTCREGSCPKRPLRGGYCNMHGGINSTCKEGGCLKWPAKGGFCVKHGGIKNRYICKTDACLKQALKGGYCVKHGGIKIRYTCKIDSCPRQAIKGGYCVKHC